MEKHGTKGCSACGNKLKRIKLLGEDNVWTDYLAFLKEVYCPNHSPIKDSVNYGKIVQKLMDLKIKLLRYKERDEESEKRHAEQIYQQLVNREWVRNETPGDLLVEGIYISANPLEQIVDSYLPLNTLQKTKFFESLGLRMDKRYSDEETALFLAHSAEYILTMKQRSDTHDPFDEETPLNDDILAAAVNGVNTATRTISELDTHTICLAITGTPGHHAAHDINHGGLCYFNNAAIVATMLANKGIRVGLIDVDAHFGNGTADIANRTNKWVHVDIHEPVWASPFSEGDSNGEGNSKNNKNLSVPIAANHTIYVPLFINAMKHIYKASPEVIVVSLGVDAHINDPFGLLALDTSTFRTVGSQIGEYLKNRNAKAIFLTEGGYGNASPNIIAETLSEANRKVYKKRIL